jgi:hypothetical protein
VVAVVTYVARQTETTCLSYFVAGIAIVDFAILLERAIDGIQRCGHCIYYLHDGGRIALLQSHLEQIIH